MQMEDNNILGFIIAVVIYVFFVSIFIYAYLKNDDKYKERKDDESISSNTK